MIETRGGDDFSRDGVVAEVPAEFNSAYLADVNGTPDATAEPDHSLDAELDEPNYYRD